MLYEVSVQQPKDLKKNGEKAACSTDKGPSVLSKM